MNNPSPADRWIGLALAATCFVLLANTLDIGIPRDESFYFKAGEEYSYWFDDLLDNPKQAFKKETVDQRFGSNGEHPALPKILFGLSWRLFGNMPNALEDPGVRFLYEGGTPPYPILGWFKETTAFRLPALLFASFLVYLIFRFGATFFTRRVGIVAALAWIFQPHAFWHSHLACFDVPIAAMWFFTAYAFLRAEFGGGWRWAVMTGVAWGLALSVKHNAFFLPPLLLLWWLVVRRGEWGIDRSQGGARLRLPAIPMSFIAMLLVSPIVYYVLWPRLWFEPIKHLKWYFAFHANHVWYWAYYFGWLYTKPPAPWGFSFIMSAVTLPGPTVLLGVTGLARVAWEWGVRKGAAVSSRLQSVASGLPKRGAGVVFFVLLNFLIPFLLIGNPKVPIFGGTKHWLPGMPFLCLLAGLAFEVVMSGMRALSDAVPRLGSRNARAALAVVAGAAFLVPAAFDTLRSTTNGGTYYNAFVGGRGAMGELGLEREFWGNSAYSAIPWLDDEAPKNAHVNFHDTTGDAVRYYWRNGDLRRDIQSTGAVDSANAYLFHWHKEFLDDLEDARQGMGATVPLRVVAEDGVPILDVWARPKPPVPTAPVPAPLPAPAAPARPLTIVPTASPRAAVPQPVTRPAVARPFAVPSDAPMLVNPPPRGAR